MVSSQTSPAAAPAHTPASAPAPPLTSGHSNQPPSGLTRRPPKSTSFKSLLATPEAESLTSSPPILEPKTNSASIAVDPQALIEAWKAYAEAIDKDVNLKYTMLDCKPLLTQKTVFDVFVHNPIQMEDLNTSGPQILQSIRNQLNDNRLQMNVRLHENDSNNKKAFTASEKYNLLKNTNPVVARLQKEFDLWLE